MRYLLHHYTKYDRVLVLYMLLQARGLMFASKARSLLIETQFPHRSAPTAPLPPLRSHRSARVNPGNLPNNYKTWILISNVQIDCLKLLTAKNLNLKLHLTAKKFFFFISCVNWPVQIPILSRHRCLLLLFKR